MKIGYKLILLCIVFLTISTISAQDNVDLGIGDIPPGQQIIITYNVTLNESLPEGLQFINNQGVITGSNINPIMTGDPDTVKVNDETLPPIGFTLNVVQLPTTGESPWYRMTILSSIIAILISVGGVFILRQKLSYFD